MENCEMREWLGRCNSDCLPGLEPDFICKSDTCPYHTLNERVEELEKVLELIGNGKCLTPDEAGDCTGEQCEEHIEKAALEALSKGGEV